MDSFKSILKDGFAISENLQQLTVPAVITSLVIALICGLIIYFTYRFFYRGVVYSDNFNVLLIMICEVTAFIIMTISANLVLSLGMVGALSIVRFRAAVKDPLDVGFLFWAVAAGLTAGAGLYLVALLGTIFISAVYALFNAFKTDNRSYLLVMRYDKGNEFYVNDLLNQIKYRLKNKTTTSSITEITIEMKIRGNDTSFLTKFEDSGKFDSVVLLEYSGDFIK